MKKIIWCKKKQGGRKIQEPNDNLSREYYKNAEESLRVLRNIINTKSNIWIATTKYYIEYFAVYSVFMKIGIKCEIHDCTLAFLKILEEKDIFEEGTYKILEEDKELRIDNQYYLKNKLVEIDFEKLSSFLISIRNSLEKLDNKETSRIRRFIEEIE